MPELVSHPVCTVMELSQRLHAGPPHSHISAWISFSNLTLIHFTGLPAYSERSLSAKLATDRVLRLGLLTSIMKGQAWLTNMINAFVNIASEGMWEKRDIMCFVKLR